MSQSTTIRQETDLQQGLPLLVEIYPKSENLLGFNVNQGRKIALRLRRAHDKNSFIDQHSLVETMLHELSHNVRGPHDDVFFAQLEELVQEWNVLRRHGRLPGQGFTRPGRPLGSAPCTMFGRESVRVPVSARNLEQKHPSPVDSPLAPVDLERLRFAAAQVCSNPFFCPV